MVNVIRGFLTSELISALFSILCRTTVHFRILVVLYDFGPVASITIKLLTYFIVRSHPASRCGG